MKLFDRIILPPELVSEPQGKFSVWVALSGGLDSCVLLHSLLQLHLPVSIKAIHVNHQISKNADAWEAFCKTFCDSLDVPFVSTKVKVVNRGQGIEAEARELRYRAFANQMAEGDFVLTAHHADDQAETFLLRLLRGSGVKGLSSIAWRRSFAGGSLVRPLLEISRADLEAYARSYQLQWVDDESNLDDAYDRNFLRNQVFPLFAERWPKYQEKIQQAVTLAQSANRLADDLAKIDLLNANELNERVGKSISLVFLRALSIERRQNLLRYWLSQFALDSLELKQMVSFEEQLIFGRVDAEAQVDIGGISLRVYKEKLFALPVKSLPDVSDEVVIVDCTFPSETRLSSGAVLVIRDAAVSAASEKNSLPAPLKSVSQPVRVQCRRGGERAHPSERMHSQSLKKLFQEYEVEPWLRDAWPLIYLDETLIAVPGLWVNHGFAAVAGESGLQLDVRFGD